MDLYELLECFKNFFGIGRAEIAKKIGVKTNFLYRERSQESRNKFYVSLIARYYPEQYDAIVKFLSNEKQSKE